MEQGQLMVPAFMILLVCHTQATTQKSPELQSPYMSEISVHEGESVLKHCTCILEAEPVLRGRDIQCLRKKWPSLKVPQLKFTASVWS